MQSSLLRFGEYLRLPNKPLLNEDGSQPHLPNKMFRMIAKARVYKKLFGKKKSSFCDLSHKFLCLLFFFLASSNTVSVLKLRVKSLKSPEVVFSFVKRH